MGKNGGVNYGMGIIAEREIYTWEIFIILDEFLQVNCVCENVMGIHLGLIFMLNNTIHKQSNNMNYQHNKTRQLVITMVIDWKEYLQKYIDSHFHSSSLPFPSTSNMNTELSFHPFQIHSQYNLFLFLLPHLLGIQIT